MDEFELIRRYFDRARPGSGVTVGIGDDGAVLRPREGNELVAVVDSLVASVHFPDGMRPADVGYRAVAVNLSDIAAMGAVPRWMTLALSLPEASEEWLDGFSEGLFNAASDFDVTLVGGDITRSPTTVISIQIIGEIAEGCALTRSGASPGDTVYVTGTVGDAAAGLQGLERGTPIRELVDRFARPSARVDYGQKLVGIASAAIDVSDGLHADLGKLLDASGVGARIDVERLPISAALSAAFGVDEQRRLALCGGDDYELCFTSGDMPPDGGPMAVTAIGTITEATGLICIAGGETLQIDDGGYRHFP